MSHAPPPYIIHAASPLRGAEQRGYVTGPMTSQRNICSSFVRCVLEFAADKPIGYVSLQVRCDAARSVAASELLYRAVRLLMLSYRHNVRAALFV